MRDIKISNVDHTDLNQILDADECLLWCGIPEYGRRFLEAVGDEKKFHIAALVGITFMWITLVLVDPDARFGRTEAIWIYAAVTVVLLIWSFTLASDRHYVLSNLAYYVTDNRVIIFRRGRNWRLRERLYVVSVPHSKTYPYSLIASRPYPSLQVGTLLSVNQVQPFGLGLSHPGHSVLRDSVTSIVTFDYIPEAQAVLDLIRSYADADAD